MIKEAKQELLIAKSISHYFEKSEGRKADILKHVNLTLNSGEIVGLLGKSGSGKSTLLRIIAGLVEAKSGSIQYKGNVISKDSVAISMVFQSFALFPWLTVLENVQLGLESLGLSKKEIRKKSIEAIDLIGLDGYESAYPRELSGGMKQRVGFARAIVSNPEILLMDEPFSALDVLTAETLKTDFLELWMEKKTPLKSVLLVTHNIEEAVFLCDRILILNSNPGQISSEIVIDLPYPRDRESKEFLRMSEKIYNIMTARTENPAVSTRFETSEASIARKIPIVSTNTMAGLIETIFAPPFNGTAKIIELENNLQVSTEEVLLTLDALSLLKFVKVAEGNVTLTDFGKIFADSENELRKKIFAKNLINNVPLAAYIKKTLNERPDHKAPKLRFLTILEDYLVEEEAEELLSAITNWARYAEIFSYDDNAEVFNLENPTA